MWRYGVWVVALSFAYYPGPLFNRVTDWANVYNSVKGDRYLVLARLHDRYGPVVRFGPNRVSFCTPTALQPIYGFRANTRKADWYRIWEMSFGAASTATIIDRLDHGKRKRILRASFTEPALKEVEHILLKNTAEFLDILEDDTGKQGLEKEVWGPARNLSVMTGYLTFDTMGEMIFSKSFNMQHSDTNRHFLGLSMDALRGLNSIAFVPYLMKMKLHILFFSRLNDGIMSYKKYCADQSDERLARERTLKTPDIWSRTFNGRDPVTGHSFTPEDLQSEAAILISVASHPMRITVSALVHYLLDNPACMGKLVRELQKTFENLEEIRMGEKLKSCVYLKACITETLRLNPSIPGIPLRTVGKGGIVVDGEIIPEGTDVGVATYALQHLEEYVADPFSFIPERWVDPSPNEGLPSPHQSLAAQQKANAVFCAFSLGPDGCLGQTMAYHQASVIVARLLWVFEMRRSEGCDGETGRIGKAMEWSRYGEYSMNGKYPPPVSASGVSFNMHNALDKFAAEGNGPWIEVRRRERNPMRRNAR